MELNKLKTKPRRPAEKIEVVEELRILGETDEEFDARWRAAVKNSNKLGLSCLPAPGAPN